EELERAARIDGASRFKAFWLIIMPLSSPGIIATAIYAFIGAWNEYVYALTFLNSESLLTLPVGLQHFFTEFATNWPGLMAAAFIMSVPVVVMFMLLQKQFVRALTEGAVKSRARWCSKRLSSHTVTSSRSTTSRSLSKMANSSRWLARPAVARRPRSIWWPA